MGFGWGKARVGVKRVKMPAARVRKPRILTENKVVVGCGERGMKRETGTAYHSGF